MTKRCLVFFLLMGFSFLSAWPVFGLTTTTNTSLNGVYCDTVEWIDRSGLSRKVWLVRPGGDPDGHDGGYIRQWSWNSNGSTKVCTTESGTYGGFGLTVNHGSWPHRGWTDSKEDGYDSNTGFLWTGSHHAIWEYRTKIGTAGFGTTPYYWAIIHYIFKDGEDQLQYALTFDASETPNEAIPNADSRSPYCSFFWYGNSSYYEKMSGFGYGTTHICTADPNTMTYDAIQPYNLCPYIEHWLTKTGFDDEMGMIATRLNTRHKTGRNASRNGTSGTFSGTDVFDFQFSDFQGWYGPRTTWMGKGPAGRDQIGVTPGYENYSLSLLIDKRSNGGVNRLVGEANAIQDYSTSLTPTLGTVISEGREGAGILINRPYDKNGFDQVYRNWVLKGDGNSVKATLTLPTGKSIKNPTFVIKDYTSALKPSSVRKNGTALNENTGYYYSVDTNRQELWVTYLSDFSGTTTVEITGPADPTGITLQNPVAVPNAVYNHVNTDVIFQVNAIDTNGIITGVYLDLRSLGGAASVAMTSVGGGNYTYTYRVPTGTTKGNKVVSVKAVDNNGYYRQIDYNLLVKLPEIVLYQDDTVNTSLGWTTGDSATEITGGAYEGVKHYDFAYNGTGSLVSINFNQLYNVHLYEYVTVAYKGLGNNQTAKLEIRGDGNWGSSSISLEPSANYRVMSIPVGKFEGGNKEKATGLRFTIEGVNVSGHLYLDYIRFSSTASTEGPLPTPTPTPTGSGPTPTLTLSPTPTPLISATPTSSPTPTPSVTPSQEPYGGIAAFVPGTIQTENFDDGGESIAYHDADSANNGNQFRTTGVDIEACGDTGGGCNVGWTVAGEWLEYTVNITSAGTYNIDFRVANTAAGAVFHLECDGQDKTGNLSVPNTGGWQTWQTVTKTGVFLNAGTHIMRLAMDTNATNNTVGNYNYISIRSATEATQTPSSSPTATITPTASPTATSTPTPTATTSGSVTTTPTSTVTPTATLINTPTNSIVATSTVTPTPTVSATATITITPTVTSTPTASVDVYIQLEAENYNANSGTDIQTYGSITFIGGCSDGCWVKYNSINLGTGYHTFTANYAVDSTYAGQKAEVRLDSSTGTLVGTLTTQNTGGWWNFQPQSISLTGANGVHDIFIVFRSTNGGVGNFDWFTFSN